MFKVAVIGCGTVFKELHAIALRALERQKFVKVVSLVDPSQKHLAQFKPLFPDARYFESPEAAFAAGNVDITLIASPPVWHRKLAEMAMASGSHVLCEKPLTTTAVDAAALVSVSVQTKRLLSVGMTRRFFPSLATASSMVADGVLGDELEFVCREGDVFRWPLTSDAAFRRQFGGGGVLMDKGVHVLDSLLWIFGKMKVTKACDDSLVNGVEGNILLALGEGSVRGRVQLSWDQQLSNGLTIKGRKGELRLKPDEFRFIEFCPSGGNWERHPCQTTWPADLAKVVSPRKRPGNYDECIALQWIAFLRAIRYGEAVPVDGESAQWVIGQIEDSYRISRPLSQGWLGEYEEAAAKARHWKTDLVESF